jgi:hypothetical protein
MSGASSFTQKTVEVTFKRGGNQNFTGTQSNTVTYGAGHRVAARISGSMQSSYQGQLDLSIWGLPLQDMFDLFTAGSAAPFVFNPPAEVSIKAGDLGGLLTTVYTGIIDSAYPEFDSMPDVPLIVHALSAANIALSTPKPTSFPGRQSVSSILQILATQAGLSFHNDGVPFIPLTDQSLDGNTYDQIITVAKAARVAYLIDGGTLTIWPNGGARTLPTVEINPSTGLQGYPSRVGPGPSFRTLFNPILQPGMRVHIKSGLPYADGYWTAVTITHNLEALVPGGEWNSLVVCQQIQGSTTPGALAS